MRRAWRFVGSGILLYFGAFPGLLLSAVAQTISDPSAHVGVYFEYDTRQTFTFPDRDLEFYAVGFPSSTGLMINRTTGAISGIPTSADVDDSPILVHVVARSTSGESFAASHEFFLNVIHDPRNSPSLAAPISHETPERTIQPGFHLPEKSAERKDKSRSNVSTNKSEAVFDGIEDSLTVEILPVATRGILL